MRESLEQEEAAGNFLGWEVTTGYFVLCGSEYPKSDVFCRMGRNLLEESVDMSWWEGVLFVCGKVLVRCGIPCGVPDKLAQVDNGVGLISQWLGGNLWKESGYLSWRKGMPIVCGEELSGGFEFHRSGIPGGFGRQVLTSDHPAVMTSTLSAEIASGRIAMLAILGIFFPYGFTGSAWAVWGAASEVAALGWAPLLAYFGFVESSGGFEDHRSGIPGFFGRQVLTSDDPAVKTNTRCAEVASGRLAMLAILGMFLLFGFFDRRVLTSGDPAVKTYTLSAEIASGRLAMLAFLGMLFLISFTGSAWAIWGPPW